MTPRDERQPAWVLWTIATAFWGFVAFLYIAQVWWLARQPGGDMGTPRTPAAAAAMLKTAIVWQGGFYVCWIPLTVLIWRVTARWDTEVGWLGQCARHALAALVLSVVQSAMIIAIAMVVLGAPPNESFTQIMVGQLRGRMYLQVVIYAAIVASGQAMLHYARSRERETRAILLEAQLSEARLEALRAQLHPHFLFNSLHAIASLVRDQRNAEAVSLISGLSDLLRRVLDSPDAKLPLTEEIELVRRYVEIQQVRFGDRVRVSFEIDRDAASARVPALLIQPVVENAIRHGLAPQVEGGAVVVRVTRDDTRLRVDVEDTGVGVLADWTLASATGTGLRNLSARLVALYGDRGVLTAGPGRSGGFRVSLALPFEKS